MPKIINLLGSVYDWKKHSGTFGIEIETEVANSTNYGDFLGSQEGVGDHVKYGNPTQYWKTISDGSLRNFGIEFVLASPSNLPKAIAALEEFREVSHKIPFIQNAPGTSVHVHINMLHEEFLTFAKYIVTWVLFENLLLDYSGANRRSNLYALGTRVAEHCCSNYIRVLTEISKDNAGCFFELSENDSKYSALNIYSMAHLGTIEVRSFRGTTDVDEIIDWLHILQGILNYCRDSTMSPTDILLEYKTLGLDLLYKIFGQRAKALITPYAEYSIDRNLVYCQWMIEAVKDWSKFGQFEVEKPSPVPTKKLTFEQIMGTMPTYQTVGSPPPPVPVIDWSITDEFPEEDNDDEPDTESDESW